MGGACSMHGRKQMLTKFQLKILRETGEKADNVS